MAAEFVAAGVDATAGCVAGAEAVAARLAAGARVGMAETDIV
jgi:hypothetical protein